MIGECCSWLSLMTQRDTFHTNGMVLLKLHWAAPSFESVMVDHMVMVMRIEASTSMKASASMEFATSTTRSTACSTTCSSTCSNDTEMAWNGYTWFILSTIKISFLKHRMFDVSWWQSWWVFRNRRCLHRIPTVDGCSTSPAPRKESPLTSLRWVLIQSTLHKSQEPNLLRSRPTDLPVGEPCMAVVRKLHMHRTTSCMDCLPSPVAIHLAGNWAVQSLIHLLCLGPACTCFQTMPAPGSTLGLLEPSQPLPCLVQHQCFFSGDHAFGPSCVAGMKCHQLTPS